MNGIVRAEILRAEVAQLSQPWRTQFAVRLRRALAAKEWRQRDAELGVLERDVMALREAKAARCAP